MNQETKAGADLIREERARQIAEEGYTPEHDDEHDGGEIAMAAACYAAPERIYVFSPVQAKTDSSETCPKCGNFRGHTVRCYEQTEKDRLFRNAVLEEAALACEREAKRWENEGAIPFRVALNCAADIRAIRALKVSEPKKIEVQP